MKDLRCPRCGGELLHDPVTSDMWLCLDCAREWIVHVEGNRAWFSRLEKL